MVDILMAVYNGEKYLKAQLESIEKQTYKQWHLIIRDDASSDRSVEIAEAFSKKFEPGKVVVLKNETASGCSKNNFMRLIHDSDAEYIMFSDQDDIWLENKAELTLKAMKRAEKTYGTEVPVLVHSDLCVVDEQLNVLSESFFDYQKLPKQTSLAQLMLQNSVTGCTVMINRRLREYLKMADCTEEIVMHDYFAALIAAVFGKIIFIKRPLILYRQHGNNVVGASKVSSFAYIKQRALAGKKQFRQRMEDTMVQTAYFNRVYDSLLVHNPYKCLLLGYAALVKANKKERIKFYVRNRALKYGIIRKIMQIIWS